MSTVKLEDLTIPEQVYAILYRAREGLESNSKNIADVYFLKYDGTLELSTEQISEQNAAIDQGQEHLGFKFVPLENGRITIEGFSDPFGGGFGDSSGGF